MNNEKKKPGLWQTKFKKPTAVTMIILGLVMFIGIVIMDFIIKDISGRGIIFIAGIILTIAGLVILPTRHHNTIIKVVFLLPIVTAFFTTVICPFILGIGYSMTDWNGISITKFVGLQNYIDIFKSTDYLYSFGVTVIYTIINMLLVNIVAFSLALVCTSSLKGKNFARASFFMPNLIGGIVLGYLWQFIFNKVLTAIVAGSASMLSNSKTAVIAIVMVSVWQYSGYIMMIYITGLQGVPKDVLEASSVDGANYWQKLKKITLPMIANTFTVCSFLTLINSFKQFDLNFAITNGGPSAIVNGKSILSTEFLALNIYKTAIIKNDYALGQAKAVIFFILLAIVSLTQVSINKKKELEM